MAQKKEVKKVSQKKVSQNKEKVVSVRFPVSDLEYLKATAFVMGMDVSQFIRTLCSTAINAAKLQEQKGQLNLEDFKALQHD